MPWHLRHRSQHSKDTSDGSQPIDPGLAKGNGQAVTNKDPVVQQKASLVRTDGTTIAKKSYWGQAADRLKDEDGGVYEALQALLQESPNGGNDLTAELSRSVLPLQVSRWVPKAIESRKVYCSRAGNNIFFSAPVRFRCDSSL